MEMALLKTKELMGLSTEDRRKRLKDLRDDLMRERGVAAMGGAPISPGKIRAVRTNIAKILTIESQLKNEEEAKDLEERSKARAQKQKPADETMKNNTKKSGVKGGKKIEGERKK